MTELARRIASLSPEQRALLERRLRPTPVPIGEPIAIIGIGCRFPGGANSPDAFWRLLAEGRDAVVPVPADRWDAETVGGPDASGSDTGLRWGGFLDRVDEFDPGFFGIAPREAAQMDPQQRLLLEVAWEALEDAGQPAEGLKGSATGVFVGIHSQSSDYYWLQVRDRSTIDTYTASGTAHSIVANRLSYLLDLRGPSVSLDTACSSSLVAVHLACQSLRTGDCDAAIAGGVNLMLCPEAGLSFAKLQMLAPDGRCKTFDASANGFGRGEGCGLVVLKRLKDAIRDGDPILALIRGTAVNQDGSTNGLTAPNGLAQQAVVRRALAVGGIEPGAMSYVETHGTGTALGDPIEVEALTAVVGAARPVGQPCVLGAVKANIGHLEAAAGIAGLIKVVLCLQHEAIPAQPHFRTLNPHISLAGSAFAIPTALTPWRRADGARIAGVSSFGFGGTNAHAVLEEAPAASHGAGASVVTARPSAGAPILLPISARSEGALRELAHAYRERLGSGEYDTPEAFRDLCYSAAVRRSHHDFRLAVSGRDAAECASRIGAFLGEEASPQVARGRVESKRHSGPVFVFSGQGPQWSGMGRELLECEPIFRAVIERCDALVQAAAGWSLLRELQAPEAASRLAKTEVAQPALFALQVGLAALWRAWGMAPSAVVGHSLGEVAAAHVAGALSLEEAVRVVVHRGRIMQQATGRGKMAAIDLAVEDARQAIAEFGDRLAIAAVNGPASTVLSGEREALDAALATLGERGVRCQPLPVNYAFHSPQMAPLAAELVRVLGSVAVQLTTTPMISTVTGRALEAGEGDAAYWGRNVRQPVLFAAAVAECLAREQDGFVEIGPHPVLSGAIAACLAAHGRTGVVAASLRRKQPERTAMLSALGTLYTHGVPVDWRKQHPAGGRCVQLPAYPWQRTRHWLTRTPVNAALPGGHSAIRGARPSRDVRLGKRLPSPIPTFQNRLNPDDFPSVRHHKIHGASVLPLTVILEMALAAAQEVFGAKPCVVEDVAIHRALVWDAVEDRTLQLMLDDRQPHAATFQLFSRSDGSGDDPFTWTLHVIGTVRLGADAGMSPVCRLFTATLEQVRARCRNEVAGTDLDDVMRAQGIACAVPDAGIETIWRGESEALGRIRGRREAVPSGGHRSSLLLAAFQLLFAVTPEQTGGDDGASPLVPVGLQSFYVANAGESAWVYARRRSDSESRSSGMIDLELWDASGGLIAQALGIRLAPLASHALGGARKAPWHDWLYEIAWRPWAPGCAEPEELARAIASDFDWSSAPGIVEYDELGPSLEALSATYISEALGALGMDLSPGSRLPAATSPAWRVADRHRRLLGRLLDILQQQGILKGTPKGWTVVGKAPTDPEERRSRLLGEHPGFVAELTLLGRCGPRLAAVLRGDCDPLDLLFPDGSVETVERLYRDSPLFAAYNRVLRDAVARAVSGMPRGKRVRILEIGAGTGSTTVHLLSALPADRTDYVFSDVSPRFVERAKERFRTHDFVRYGVLDIEREPETQGFTAHSFDLVIAANVLHATRDVRQALQHTARLLAPGGLLTLFEVTARQGWVDLTFGLTDGWWRFADHGLRHDYPLLTLPEWDGLLRDLGFRRPSAIVGPNGLARDARQAILLAGAPETASTASKDRDSVSTVDAPPSWLLLADPGGLAGPLAERVTRRGEQCHIIRRHEDVAERVKTLSRDGSIIVVDLRAVRGVPLSRAESLEVGCELLLVSAVSLVQNLVRIGNPQVRLWIVTQGAQAAGEEQVSEPDVAQATLWGLGRGINLEHPEVWGGLVDLDPTGDPAVDLELLLDVLANPVGEDQVALRRGMALVPRLTRVSAEPGPALTVRADATYLISGGLGGLGLEVAHWLAGRGARHLVLATRRGLPDRRTWAELPEGSEDSRRTRGVASLEAAGASVSVVSVDVADFGTMAALLEGLEQSQAPLRGIIHAAADLHQCPVGQLDRAILQAMLRPKIGGALVLHTLTQKRELDFFVLFSSTAAVWGAAGWAHYAAGNAALDALAYVRRRRGLPGLSVNWGTWATMRAFSPEERMQVERFGLQPMQAEDALAALGAVLGGASPQRVVAAVDWERLRSAFEARRRLPLLMEIGNPTIASHGEPRAVRPGKDLLLEQLASAAPPERLAILAEHVAGNVGKALGLDVRTVDHNRGFFDMGMDSLTSAELRRSLQTRLGHALPATLAFNYPTVTALAAYLAAEVLPLLGLPVDATGESGPVAISPAAPRADAEGVGEADARLSEGDLLARLRRKLQKLR